MELRLEGKKYFIPEEWIDRWNLLRDYKEDVGGTMMELDISTVTSEQLFKWYKLNITMRSSTHLVQPEKKMMNVSEAYNTIQFFGPVDGSYLLYCKIDDALTLNTRDSLYKELGKYVRSHGGYLSDTGLANYLDRDPYVLLKNMTEGKSITEAAEQAMELAEAIPLEILYGVYYNADQDEPSRSVIDWTTVNWSDLKALGQRMKNRWVDSVAGLLSYCDAHKTDKYLSDEDVIRAIISPPSVLPTGTTHLMLMEPIASGIYQGGGSRRIRLNTSMSKDALLSGAQQIALKDNDLYVLSRGELLSDDVLVEPVIVRLYSTPEDFNRFLYVQVPQPVEYFDRLYSYIENVNSWNLLEYMTGLQSILAGIPLLEKQDNLQAVGYIIQAMWEDIVGNDESDQDAVMLEELVNMIAVHLGRRCLIAMSNTLLSRVGDVPRSLLPPDAAKLKEGVMTFCKLAIEKAEDDSLPMGLTKWYSEARIP